MFFKNSGKEKTLKKYQELQKDPKLNRATFSGGCFWCLEGPFKQLDGVADVIAGYSGGHPENPSYEEVVSGTTGHRESVQVFFDPQKISYETLLETFFWQIDPTDPGGQFADRGEQYTTAVFYHDEKQLKDAENYLSKLSESGKYQKPIATKILPFKNFYPAEDYHQAYHLKNAERYKRYYNLSGRKDYVENQQ
jgi:methionine-S-sulfoxide reductase